MKTEARTKPLTCETCEAVKFHRFKWDHYTRLGGWFCMCCGAEWRADVMQRRRAYPHGNSGKR